jgi:hypothetical protein
MGPSETGGDRGEVSGRRRSISSSILLRQLRFIESTLASAGSPLRCPATLDAPGRGGHSSGLGYLAQFVGPLVHAQLAAREYCSSASGRGTARVVYVSTSV